MASTRHVQPLSGTFALSTTSLCSNYYDDFAGFNLGDDDDKDDDKDDDEDEEDDDEDEDDDDEVDEIDDDAVADFRSRMGSLFGPMGEDTDSEGEGTGGDGGNSGRDPKEQEAAKASVEDLIKFAGSTAAKEGTDSSVTLSSSSSSPLPSTDWAEPSDNIEPGVVLVANPAKFCSDFGPKVSSPSAALLSKFGLNLPPNADLGPDRRAELLPVLCLVGKHPIRGSQAVLLNRRTGYLLGDLEQQEDQEDKDGTGSSSAVSTPKLGAFMIQPLWFGGTSAGGSTPDDGNEPSGLVMLHQCDVVPGAVPLTEDGLYWGGNPEQAQEALNNPTTDRVYTGFDFKFFVQGTRWLPLQLEKEVRDETWFVARVSKEVIFKPRDRVGTKRAKPLWTEIMELMGGKFADVRDQLYADDAPFP